MVTQLQIPAAGYFISNLRPDLDRGDIRVGCERQEPEMRAYFVECRRNGCPYIEYNPECGIFRYVYFDRREIPSQKLFDELNALGRSFGMAHWHVLRGDVFQEYLESSGAIPYQGRFNESFTELTPEQIQGFVAQLSQLLPRFDRPATVQSLVDEAIEAGYFTYNGDCYYGDLSLECDAMAAYYAWCRSNHRPGIVSDEDEGCITFDCAAPLTSAATSRIEVLANSVGLKGPDDQSDGHVQLEPIDDVNSLNWDIQIEKEFVNRLSEILADPQSYRSSQT